jgi:hypothetical protein
MSGPPTWGGGILTEQEWLDFIGAVRASPRIAAAWSAHKLGITFEEAMERGGRRPGEAENAGDQPPSPTT